MTPATGGLIPAGTELRLGDGHGHFTSVGRLAGPVELHYTDPAGDDAALAEIVRAFAEPITVTVPIATVSPELIALAFGVPLAFIDPARAAAELALLADEPGRWESEGGAPA